MVELAALQDQIRDFVAKQFLVEFGDDLTDETDLFDAGVIDSYGFIDLVSFLEKTYGVTLSDDDLASPGMSTLAGIAQMVAQRQSGS